MNLYGQKLDLRSAPTPEFIAALRSRYAVEPEIDRVLSRKMARRAEPGFTRLPLENLLQGAQALIQSEIGTEYSIENPRWLKGGSSKLQIAFELQGQSRLRSAVQPDKMVLRMDPPEAIVETSRRREFEVLRLVKDVVPVPPAYWVDPDGRFLSRPAMICGFVAGTNKPTMSRAFALRGAGANFGPHLREKIGDQFVSHLAALHTIEHAKLNNLIYLAAAEMGSNASVIRQVGWWKRVWEEDRPRDLPLVDVAARWLIANAPPLDHVSLVHGDYRVGNVLFSEEQGRITAILDWECAVLGDRHQDLAWITGDHFGHYAEDGTTFLASGFFTVNELLHRYEAASGLAVDLRRLKYFRIFNDFMSTVHMLGTAWRIAHLGKTHQDVKIAWVCRVGNMILGKLRASLQEEL